MKLVTVSFPDAYLDGLEMLIDSGHYPNRSEAIRMAVRDLLVSEEQKQLRRPTPGYIVPSKRDNSFVLLEDL
jgi:Arc/MetJ-type ribon-helix-helix transcriptional regulator